MREYIDVIESAKTELMESTGRKHGIKKLMSALMAANDLKSAARLYGVDEDVFSRIMEYKGIPRLVWNKAEHVYYCHIPSGVIKSEEGSDLMTIVIIKSFFSEETVVMGLPDEVHFRTDDVDFLEPDFLYYFNSKKFKNAQEAMKWFHKYFYMKWFNM